VLAAVVADRALVLSLITGAVALTLAYIKIRRHIVRPDAALLDAWQARAQDATLEEIEHEGTFDKAELARGTSRDAPSADEAVRLTELNGKRVKWSRVFAVVTPLAFLGVIGIMVLPRVFPWLPALRGGEAAALVGGVAFLLMMLVTTSAVGARRMLDVCPEHMTDGFVFAFKAMGSVLPIAGFFFVGAHETATQILGVTPEQAPGLLFEVISAGQHLIPSNHFMVAFGVLLVGMITGIDGSGFAGLPLTGTLAGALAPVSGLEPATLAAVGQMGAVWTGGGTLIAWSSLIAVAGFARVHVLELVRAMLFPVVVALCVSTICAVLIFP